MISCPHCAARGITCEDSFCPIAGPGAPGDARQCRVCWLRLEEHRRKAMRPVAHPVAQAATPRLAPRVAPLMGQPLTRTTEIRFDDERPLRNERPRTPAPCEHLGRSAGRTVPCSTCRATEIPLLACAVHGVCTQAKQATDRSIPCCRTCQDYQTWPLRFDESSLWPEVSGKRFNASLIEYQDGYLLAARNGWKGSEIYLGRLDGRFRPIGRAWKLNLHHAQEAAYGREDPRLFWHAGRLHIAYIGVTGTVTGKTIRHTSQLYARLNDSLQVEQVFLPRLVRRQAWEKNWAMFSHGGELFAVYQITPHRILRLDGERCEFVHSEDWHPRRQGGEMRGGAAPVRVGEEYWHFFHDRIEQNGRKVYRTGLYTFLTKPPFRPARFCREPLLTADPRTRPADQYASVVFTCGAVRRGEEWILSSGIHDRWTHLDRFRHEDLERRLVNVGS